MPEKTEDLDAKQVTNGNSPKITYRSHSLPPTSSPISSGAVGGSQPSVVQETPGRLEVGSFLRLADLLHEKVVDDSGQEFHDTQGGNDAVYGDRDSGDEMECGRGVWMGSNGNACRIRYIHERLRRFASEAVYRPWFSRTSQVFLFGPFWGDGGLSDYVALISFLLYSFFCSILFKVAGVL